MTALGQRHGSSLRELILHNNARGGSETGSDFAKVVQIHLFDMDQYWLPSMIEHITANNRHSLEHLTLGCERTLFKLHNTDHGSDVVEELQGFASKIEDGVREAVETLREDKFEETLPEAPHGTIISGALRSLRLINYALSYSWEPNPGGIIPLFNFDYLITLTLESCFAIYEDDTPFQLLSIRGKNPGKTWTPRLKNFSLRHEAANETFQEPLRLFFAAFKGLINLSVLLEGPGPLMYPECFIENHGSTLKTLVWDQRTRRRADASQSTAIFEEGTPASFGTKKTKFSRFICEISRGCPELRELGLVACPSRNGDDYNVWMLCDF